MSNNSKVSFNGDDNSDSDNTSFFDPPIEHYAQGYLDLGQSRDSK